MKSNKLMIKKMKMDFKMLVKIQLLNSKKILNIYLFKILLIGK